MESSVPLGLGVRRGAWTEEEDELLKKCVHKYGEGKWHRVPFKAGLNRCRKSCRMRWLNYLRPNIKRGGFAEDEVDLIIRLHKLLGNRWSLIAGRLPGRTAVDVKNYWNTHLQKRLTGEREGGVLKPKTPIMMTKSKIIRPRPWSFSKNSPPSSIGLKTTTNIVDAKIQTTESLAEARLPPPPLPLPPSPSLPGADGTSWFDNLNFDLQTIENGIIGGGSTELMEGEELTGESSFLEGNKYWSDIFSNAHVDLWDLFG